MPYLKIALAMTIVGSSVVFGKLIISSFPVYLASELRFVIAALILLPLMVHQEKRFPAIKQRDFFILFLQALTGVFLFNICMLYGLKLTIALEAGIITSVIPAVVGLVAVLFLKERLTLKKSLGILLAVIGVLAINMLGDQSEGSSTIAGNLLIFGAVIGEAFFITLGKSVSNRVTPLTISTIMSLFGVVLFLPFAIVEARNFDFGSVSLLDWANILYFGIVVTVIAFLLMYQGLSDVPANAAGVFTSMIPISSVVLSFFILQEKILLSHVVGILFVLAAIWLIANDSSNKTIASESSLSQ